MKWQLARERFRIEDPLPPPPRRPEKSIGDILPGVLQNQPPLPELPAGLAEHWPLIAGEQIAQHTRPVHIREEILHIWADHPGWLVEIRRLPKHHFLKKLETVPGMPTVRDIRFMLDPAIGSGRRRGR